MEKMKFSFDKSTVLLSKKFFIFISASSLGRKSIIPHIMAYMIGKGKEEKFDKILKAF